MLGPIHVGVALMTFGVRVLFAEQINAAQGASCCSSAHRQTTPCESGIDGETDTEFLSLYVGVGLWYTIDLKRVFRVTGLALMDRSNYKMKDIRLTFSDGSTQEFMFPNRVGIYWANYTIKPVFAYSVTIKPLSLHSGDYPGFLEVKIYADSAVIPTDPGESCPYRVIGNLDKPASHDTLAAVRRNKPCMLECVRNKACVAALLPIESEDCIHYHLNCTADKAVYGEGYIMWRPKRL